MKFFKAYQVAESGIQLRDDTTRYNELSKPLGTNKFKIDTEFK